MTNKIRVFEAFAGYGSQSIALRNIGVEHEVVAISEIDKYATIAYEAIHGPVNNLGDISKIKVEDIPEHDLFTYSFPCQDISVAGSRNGIEKGKTRSGLLYECEKIIEHCRPKYLLMENVKNLVGKKFKPKFDEWLAYLETLGYKNYWQVLNSKDYGMPQNRERVFCVSILGEHNEYEFPKPMELKLRLKDLLEDNIDSKYYVSDEVQSRFKPKENKSNFNATDSIDVIGKLECKGWYDIESRVHSINGIAPTLETRNRAKYMDNFKIRKLTCTEAYRLMGLYDEDIKKIQECNLSNTQQYKMAGNSIVVNVLEEIFRNLFLEVEDRPTSCK